MTSATLGGGGVNQILTFADRGGGVAQRSLYKIILWMREKRK